MNMRKEEKMLELSDDDKLHLINCIQARPVLWHYNNEDYSKRDKREEQFAEIAADMAKATNKEFTIAELKRVWHNLRVQYNNNKRLAKRKQPTWKFYAKMAAMIETNSDIPEPVKRSGFPLAEEAVPNKNTTTINMIVKRARKEGRSLTSQTRWNQVIKNEIGRTSLATTSNQQPQQSTSSSRSFSGLLPQQNYHDDELQLDVEMAQPPPPIVKMCRQEQFSSAHRLHNPVFGNKMNEKVYGKCNNLNGHGHNYTWRVVLKGPVDPQTGMVYNLADLKREMAQVMELVDHKNLDLDVAYFRENQIVSTTENLAVFLYNELKARMSEPWLLSKVAVDETGKNSFSYSGDQLPNNYRDY